jgi:DNA-binding NarL/FixJ family response regulator
MMRLVSPGEGTYARAHTRLISQFTTWPAERPSGRQADQIRQALTGREQDVFSHIATGMSNSEIAASLHLSEGTGTSGRLVSRTCLSLPWPSGNV